jgi:hypothetical protein
MNKFHKTEALIATLTLTVFTAGTVFAAPPGPPPTPNAPSASFSSVSVTPTAGTGIYVNGVSGDSAIYADSPNTFGIEGKTSSSTAAGVFGWSTIGNGVMGVGNAVGKNGVYGTSTNGRGVYGSSINGTGVLGMSGGASPESGVYGMTSNGAGVGVFGVNNGASSIGMGVYGYSANNHGVFGYSNARNGLWGQTNDNTGLYSGVYGYSANSTGVRGSTVSGTAARFNNVGVGGSVDIAGSTYALDVSGTPSRFNTAVDLQGAINNSSVLNAGYVRFSDNIVMDPGRHLYTSVIRGETYDSATNTSVTGNLGLAGFPDLSLSAQYASGGLIKLNSALAGVLPNSVTVRDPTGFAMENATGSGYAVGTQTFMITENGHLSALTAEPVTIRDNDGFAVKNTFGTQTFLEVDSAGRTTMNGPSTMWSDSLTVNTAAYGGAAIDANNTNGSSGFGLRGSGTVGVSGSGSVAGVSGSTSGSGSGISGTASSGSGQAGTFFNGLYSVQIATPSYGIYSTGPVYATSTATGSAATITANLPAAYNGNGVNATVNNAGSYGVYSSNSAGGYAYYGIGNMYLSGTPYKPGGGSWAVPSDLRLKDVKSTYQKGLESVMKINPIVYKYKVDNEKNLPTDKEYVGLAAQEIEEVIPEAINKDDQGYLTVNNDPIIWTMLNAIKEIAADLLSYQEELDGLKKQNAELTLKLIELEDRLEKLERN